MTEEQMRELISNQQEEINQYKLTIEALETKTTTSDETIEKLNQQINDLKIKNHDLFLKVVQEPIIQPKEEQIKEPVQSLSDLTNKLIWG